jgi:EcsC family protein
MPFSNLPSKARALAQPADIGRSIGKVVLTAIDTAIQSRWTHAQSRAKQTSGESVDEKVRALSKSFAQELGTVGAATGAAAAVPAVGTAASVTLGVGDFTWFTVRASELILIIAALHGHTRATVEERRAWILSVLAFGNGASEGFAKLAGEVGKGLGRKATERIPMKVLGAINSKLGRTIVTKYGTKRGVIALGTALPFGIGFVVGGGANYVGVRLLARHANNFFKNLPYISVEPALAV